MPITTSTTTVTPPTMNGVALLVRAWEPRRPAAARGKKVRSQFLQRSFWSIAASGTLYLLPQPGQATTAAPSDSAWRRAARLAAEPPRGAARALADLAAEDARRREEEERRVANWQHSLRIARIERRTVIGPLAECQRELPTGGCL